MHHYIFTTHSQKLDIDSIQTPHVIVSPRMHGYSHDAMAGIERFNARLAVTSIGMIPLKIQNQFLKYFHIY